MRRLARFTARRLRSVIQLLFQKHSALDPRDLRAFQLVGFFSTVIQAYETALLTDPIQVAAAFDDVVLFGVPFDDRDLVVAAVAVRYRNRPRTRGEEDY